MINSASEIKKIGKEQLDSVTFQNATGIFPDLDVRDRNRKFHFSMLMANHNDALVKIVFNTLDGYKELCAAIWGATEKYILLKGGCFIPVESVAYVSLSIP